MKEYKFELVITEGNDEFWEAVKGDPDEILLTLKEMLREWGFDENGIKFTSMTSWQCIKCQTVHAPFVTKCECCKIPPILETITEIIGPFNIVGSVEGKVPTPNECCWIKHSDLKNEPRVNIKGGRYEE